MYSDLKKLCIQETNPIYDAVRQMDSSRMGICLVVDSQNRLQGTITDGDIRRAVLAHVDLNEKLNILLNRKKGTHYEKPITSERDVSPALYLKKLKQHNILHLPIVDKANKVLGLVRMEDFLSDKKLPIRAVLMAGGFGTRLLPLTKNMPKTMLPIGEKPLMEIIINNLRQSGIRNVNISTHHESEKISNHFKDGRDFDVEVSYLNEDKPLGTAGALGRLKKSSESLLVMNADILTNMDFRAMHQYHKDHKADITVAVRQYDFKVPYGIMEVENQKVIDMKEKPVYKFFVNAGIYLMEPSVLSHLANEGEKLDMPDLIQHVIKDKGLVVSYPILEQWIDIGQHENYKEAQELVKTWSKS